MATETEIVQAAQDVATDAFTSYLQGAEINPDNYKKVTGASVQDDAQVAVEDNSDYLSDIANERGGLSAVKDAVQNDSATQDMLFDDYVQAYMDMEEDYKKQNMQYAKQEILSRITSVLDDDGITSKLLASACGVTAAELSSQIAQQLLKDNPDGVYSEEGFVDIPLVDDYITPYEDQIREKAGAKVYDDLMEQYKVRDTSPLSRISNYETDNCRYASGLMSLEAYIEKNLPEVNSED